MMEEEAKKIATHIIRRETRSLLDAIKNSDLALLVFMEEVSSFLEEREVKEKKKEPNDLG